MMIRFYQFLPLGLACCMLACSAPAPPPASRTANPEAPRDRVGHIVERYWDESASLSPWYSWGDAEARYEQPPVDVISPQALADALAIERRFLDNLHDVSRGALDPDSRLTYDIFRRERELSIESFTYPIELMPVNPFDSVPQRFALMAAAAARRGLTTDKDLARWQAAADEYGRWTTQAISNMREGLRRGYSLPRVLVDRVLPQLAAMGDDSPGNVFYRALSPAPVSVSPAGSPPDPSGAVDSGASRAGAIASGPATDAVRERILPAYRRLHDFMQNEYRPRARETIGMAALPLGEAWYAYLVKRATGGGQTPVELHAQGIAEVEHLHARMQGLLSETAFGGNAQGLLDNMRHDPKQSYADGDALLAGYQGLKAQAPGALFTTVPKADYDIRRVEAFRQSTAPALSYRRSMAYGSIPAMLYVNTGDLEARPATGLAAQFLREAVPGLHFLLSLQQERVDLPKFRRFGGAPAFIEGWGLYASSLGEELGVYRDVEAKFCRASGTGGLRGRHGGGYRPACAEVDPSPGDRLPSCADADR